MEPASSGFMTVARKASNYFSADDDIARLDEAAKRFELDAEGLRAGASAALAAPDREIRIEVGKGLVAAEAAEADAA